MWDMSKIKVVETLKGGYSLSINSITSCKKSCWITNVYGPYDYEERRFVWLVLVSLSGYCTGAWCIGGKCNITRWAHECFPLEKQTRGMRQFNNPIDSLNIWELPLQNGRCTWSREGSSISRSLLDPFFIDKEWDEISENSRVGRKAHTISDHFPLLLEARSIKWGPSPFRFSNRWLPFSECNRIIKEVWNITSITDWAGFVLIGKLRKVKAALELWNEYLQEALKRKEEELLKEIEFC